MTMSADQRSNAASGDELQSTPTPRDCSVCRRDLMKAIGAGAAAATVGSTTASAAADESFWTNTDGEFDPYDPSVAAIGAGYPLPWAAAWLADTIWDEINQNPDSGDGVILHSQATSAAERKQANELLWGNYLQDMHTIANIEARHAIASAWEDGKNASTAYADALTAIRSYYEPHEVNMREMLAQTMLDLGSVSDARDGTESDGSIAPWVNDSSSYTGSGTDVHCRITAANYTENKTITLHNGTEYEMGVVPHFRFYVRDASDSYEVPFDEVISSYDTSGSTVTVTGDSYDWTTSLQFSVPNVPDADLQGERVFDFAEWLKIYNEIESQSDMVAGNYSESFVSDLYAELDAGNIDPSDVRGVEGQVRFMSGTEDATSTSYRMALLQQLDMNQADLSKVASMKVQYTGPTNKTFETNSNGDRTMVVTDPVDAKTYEGQLFSRRTPPNGFEVGKEYASEGFIAGYSAGNSTVRIIDPSDLSVQTEWSVNDPNAFSISPDGKTAITCTIDTTSNVYVYDTHDGTQIRSFTGRFDQARFVDDERFVAARDGDANEIALMDVNGNTEWTGSKSTINSATAVGTNGSIAAMGAYGITTAYDVETGEELWSTDSTIDQSVGSVRVSPSGNYVTATYGPNLVVYDASDGTEVLNQSYSNDVYDAIVLDDSSVLVSPYTTTIENLALSDGSQNWSVTTASKTKYLAVNASMTRAITDSGGDGIYSIDLEAAEVASSGPAVVGGLRFWPNQSTDYAGYAGETIMYDGPSGSELQLSRGSFTIQSMSDADGNSVETTNWDDPDYDTYDATEYATYTTKVNEYLESIGYWDDSSSSGSGGGGGLFGGNFLENLFAGLSAGAIALVAIGLIALDKITN